MNATFKTLMLDVIQGPDDKIAVSAILNHRFGSSFGDIFGEVIVWRETEIIGVAACMSHWSRRDRWLNSVSVKSGHERQGIGRRMISHFIDKLQSNQELWLETFVWNKAFYQRLGFTWIPIADRPNHFASDPRLHRTSMLMAMTPGEFKLR